MLFLNHVCIDSPGGEGEPTARGTDGEPGQAGQAEDSVCIARWLTTMLLLIDSIHPSTRAT